jgi:hypothetical protein
VITGRINPSGKLSETFPRGSRYADLPDFPALNRRASYGEGVFIGYRYCDKKDVGVSSVWVELHTSCTLIKANAPSIRIPMA